jgi:hypothetical protein
MDVAEFVLYILYFSTTLHIILKRSVEFFWMWHNTLHSKRKYIMLHEIDTVPDVRLP